VNVSPDFLKELAVSGDPSAIVVYAADDSIRTSVSAAMPTVQIRDGGIQTAITAMSQQDPPEILVVDFADLEAPESALRTLRTLCSPTTKIVGVGSVNDIHLFHSLVDAGATDYLVKPFTAEEFTRVIEHVTIGAAKDAINTNARTVLVTGIRGGVGASSLVTGMGWHLAERAGVNVAIVDLDLIFGTVALEYDLEPSHGLREILENPERVDSLFIDSAVVHATEHLSILAAEELLEDPPDIKAGAMDLLIAELSKQSDCIFVDVPCSLLVAHPEIMSQASHLVIVSEMKLAAIRDIMRLATFVRDSGREISLSVIANKVSSKEKPEVTKKEFARGIGMPVEFVLPWDPKALTEAAKSGRAVTDAVPKSPLSRGIIDAAMALSHQQDAEIEKKSFWSQFKKKKK
jgi:pilus assembly protein CpaE